MRKKSIWISLAGMVLLICIWSAGQVVGADQGWSRLMPGNFEAVSVTDGGFTAVSVPYLGPKQSITPGRAGRVVRVASDGADRGAAWSEECFDGVEVPAPEIADKFEVYDFNGYHQLFLDGWLYPSSSRSLPGGGSAIAAAVDGALIHVTLPQGEVNRLTRPEAEHGIFDRIAREKPPEGWGLVWVQHPRFLASGQIVFHSNRNCESYTEGMSLWIFDPAEGRERLLAAASDIGGVTGHLRYLAETSAGIVVYEGDSSSVMLMSRSGAVIRTLMTDCYPLFVHPAHPIIACRRLMSGASIDAMCVVDAEAEVLWEFELPAGYLMTGRFAWSPSGTGFSKYVTNRADATDVLLLTINLAGDGSVAAVTRRPPRGTSFELAGAISWVNDEAMIVSMTDGHMWLIAPGR